MKQFDLLFGVVGGLLALLMTALMIAFVDSIEDPTWAHGVVILLLQILTTGFAAMSALSLYEYFH